MTIILEMKDIFNFFGVKLQQPLYSKKWKTDKSGDKSIQMGQLFTLYFSGSLCKAFSIVKT